MTKKSLKFVTFYPMKCMVEVKRGANIFNTAMEAGVSIRTECGGKGICGKCKVIIHNKNAVNALTEAEIKHLFPQEIKSGYRLACQVILKQDVDVTIPEESRIGARKILAFGLERQLPLKPLVRKFHLKLRKPLLSDIKPDFERLTHALSTVSDRLEVDYEILRKLPDLLRKAGWDITTAIWDSCRIIAVEPGDTSDKLFGFAVDIGTSKIVGHLVNLATGATLSVSSIENPQIIYGADVMTRITFAMDSEANLRMLQKIVIEGINKVLTEVCEKARVDSRNVYEVTIVGNTAMHHLFLGIQPKYVALSPYVPTVKSPINVTARELNIKINPNSVVSVLPVIAGFVGADAIGDVLATDFHRLNKPSLLMDVGTNTEILVGNSDDILSCSCASGPAFEGAKITHGMKAENRAIERVRINSDLNVEYKTIGNVKPTGLCGSAMIDVVAEMLKRGIISHKGKFNSQIETPRLKRDKNQTQFVVAWENETATNKEITITQKDIAEIQLAKAAIYAGCSILMKIKSLKKENLDKVFIAGAFGNYINPENAKFIGLVPDVPIRKIKFVGNTAVVGAKMALVSREVRKTAETLSRKIRYLELATDPEFDKEFFDAMFVPHKDLNRFPSVKEYFKKHQRDLK